MEKKTTSGSSICWKIRHAFATNPAFRAIRRIKHYHQEPRPVITHSKAPSLPTPTQNMKAGTQGEGAIPIKFDYSIPTSISKVHGQVSKVSSSQVGISEIKGKVATKVEPEPYYVQGSKVGAFKETTDPLKEQQGKKTLDINDAFTEYIERAKYRIRTVSNVGRGQNNRVANEANGCSGNNNRMENHKDHFSDFIQHAKKRIRTTSGVGKTISLKRG